MNVYTAFDKVANKPLCVFASPSDGLAIRENAPALSRVLPLGDIELRKIGTISDDCKLESVEMSVVSWDSYKFPENPIQPLDKNDKSLTMSRS